MLSIIAAAGNNGTIGVNNDLPWKLSADLKYFSKITADKSVLMGRKTYESIVKKIGHPLLNRKNYVLSRRESLPGAEIVKDINSFIHGHEKDDVFVIGGASIFELTLAYVDKMYITEVDCDCAGDAFFPKFNEGDWKLISEEKHSKDGKNEYNYTFKVYDRKK